LIYRFVQEGLNNIAKHAEASWIEAVVQRRGDLVEVTVRDNGRGFDPEQAAEGAARAPGGRGGFGLIGMRERVELAGGELRIESQPGKGTTLRATVPLKPALAAGLAQRSSSPRSST
jgi:signal transduction histidine kinase